MAHLQGFTRAAVANMLNHYTRHDGDPHQEKYTYGNQNIDPSRTKYNYALFERDDPMGFIDSKISECDSAPRKNASVLSDWIVTLPQNDKLKGREKEFFELAFEHIKEAVGEENIVGAFVHMDETSPHIHVAFVPVYLSPVTVNDKSSPLRWTASDEKRDPAHKAGDVKRDKNGTARYRRVPALDDNGNPMMKRTISQTQLFNRRAMRDFHPQLSQRMEKHFGFDVGVELSDLGDKQLSHLDHAEYKAAKETLRKTKEDVERLSDKRDEIRQQADEEADRLEALRQRGAKASHRVGMLGTLLAVCRAASSAALSQRSRGYASVSSCCNAIARKLGYTLARAAANAAQEHLTIRFADSVKRPGSTRQYAGHRRQVRIEQRQKQREYTPSL